MHSCLVAVDDIDKGRLQAGATDEEAINVGLLGKRATVSVRYTTAVQNAGILGGLARNLVLEPFADGGMDFLCLLRGCNFASADSPIGERQQASSRVEHTSTHQMGS